MAKNYIKQGESVNYTNLTGTAITSGSPVVVGNNQMGIALVDIAINATGAVAMEGVWKLTKDTSSAVTLGQKLWWDAVNLKILNAPILNSWFIGYCDKAEAAATAVCSVLIEEFINEGPRLLSLAASGTISLNAGDFNGGHLNLLVTNTAAQTVNFPSVAVIAPGSRLFVRKTSAAAFAVTLDPAGSEQIAGGATYATIASQNALGLFASDGAAWQLLQAA